MSSCLGQPVARCLAPQCGCQTGACSAMDARCWLPLVVAAFGYERPSPSLWLAAAHPATSPIVWRRPGLPKRVCGSAFTTIEAGAADGLSPAWPFPCDLLVACEPHTALVAASAARVQCPSLTLLPNTYTLRRTTTGWMATEEGMVGTGPGAGHRSVSSARRVRSGLR